jgi:hypothetical protein
LLWLFLSWQFKADIHRLFAYIELRCFQHGSQKQIFRAELNPA